MCIFLVILFKDLKNYLNMLYCLLFKLHLKKRFWDIVLYQNFEEKWHNNLNINTE